VPANEAATGDPSGDSNQPLDEPVDDGAETTVNGE